MSGFARANSRTLRVCAVDRVSQRAPDPVVDGERTRDSPAGSGKLVAPSTWDMYDPIEIPGHLVDAGHRHLLKVLAHGVRRQLLHRPRCVTMSVEFRLLHFVP